MDSDIPPIEASHRFSSPEKDVAILATGAGIALGGRVGGRGLYAITEIALARMLGPALFGLFTIGTTILRIVGTIGMLGLNNGVIHFGTKYWRTSPSNFKSVLYYSISISLASGVFLGISLFLLTPWLAVQVFKKPDLVPVFNWIAFLFPLAIGLWVSAAATRITQRMQFSIFAMDLAQPGINLILIIAIALVGLTLSRVLSATVISYAAALGLSLFFIIHLFSEAVSSPFGSKFSSKELLVYSMPTGLAGTFALLTGWTSRLFIVYYHPAEIAGIYQAASQISILFIIILEGINAIFAPMIADMYVKKEIKGLEELYRISTKWGLYMSIPIFLVICIIPQEFMVAIFGEAYAKGAIPLVILAITQVVNVGTGAVGFLLIMTGHQKRWFLLSLITMSLNLILNALLVPRIGMIGAALATAIAVCGLFIAGLVQVRLILDLWPYDRRFIKGALAAGITAAVLFGLIYIIGFRIPILSVVLLLSISAITFGLLLLLQGLDKEDKDTIQNVVHRIRFNKNLGS